MKMREEYTCPLELTHDMIKGKWKPVILWQLSKGPASLSALKKEIAGISQKMLLQHLNELQSCGVVEKKTYEGYPLKVEYFLTPRGHKIFGAVTIMQEVGIEIMREDKISSFFYKKISKLVTFNVTRYITSCVHSFLLLIMLFYRCNVKHIALNIK